MAAASILIIEDEHALGAALSLAVRRMGHLPTLVASGGAGLEALRRERFDALVLDIGLPDMSGLAVLERLRAEGSDLPVLIVTAHATLDHAIASQKLGATDYLMKPLDLRRFESSLSSLVAREMVQADAVQGECTVTLIGAAPCMRDVFLGVARACAGEGPVMIHGPSGSGKTLAAKVIHANSSRSGKELALVESSTIRSVDAMQALILGRDGTVVLEEIGGLSGELQSCIAVMIGDAAVNASARLIVTSGMDPRDAVERGLMREDLFYALSALTIPMPPLCERSGDIPALSQFVLGLRHESAAPVSITAPALCAMQAYSWPGNVRELRHTLNHALAMSRGGPVFAAHLPPHVAAALQDSGGHAASGELEATIGRWLDAQLSLTPETSWNHDDLMDGIEAVALKHLLGRFEMRPTRMAAALRMNRATLRQKLRRLGIERGKER